MAVNKRTTRKSEVVKKPGKTPPRSKAKESSANRTAKKTAAKKNAASQARRVVANTADRAIAGAGEVAFRATGSNRVGDANSARRRASRAAAGVTVNAHDRISRRNTGQGVWERGHGPGGPSLRELNSRRASAPKQARKKTKGKGK